MSEQKLSNTELRRIADEFKSERDAAKRDTMRAFDERDILLNHLMAMEREIAAARAELDALRASVEELEADNAALREAQKDAKRWKYARRYLSVADVREWQTWHGHIELWEETAATVRAIDDALAEQERQQ